MRLLRDRTCGPLLELGVIQRRLHLGTPVSEGEATISVAHIIGTVHRGRDFDGCFQPLRRDLQKRLRDIIDASPSSLDEPIEVVRVDRAYFVVDGHKRVAIARRTGREFLDARVSRIASPYAMTADVDAEAIERTAREGEFRRHTGLAEARPEARFPLNDITGYGELFLAVHAYAHDVALRLGRPAPRAETAAEWYDSVYLPLVERGRSTVGSLVDACTDADLFLTMHRLARSSWGSECGAAECAADMLLAERRRAAREGLPFQHTVARLLADERPPELLPLAKPAEEGR